MNIKKTALTIAITASLTISIPAYADLITYDFTGKMTWMNTIGDVQLNSDASDGSQGDTGDFGFRSAFSGIGTFDTASGAGSVTMNPISFLGSGNIVFSSITYQAIGDGLGGGPLSGTLMASQMEFSWNGSSGVPVNAVFDAAGFLGSIQAPGNSWSVSSGCAGCTTSTTSDWTIMTPVGSFGGAVGDGPIVMTNFNTPTTSIAGMSPFINAGLIDDGIAGSPMTTSPFNDFNFAFDFTSMNATNQGIPAVPVPTAFWLFSSGLIGLISVAKRRRLTR